MKALKPYINESLFSNPEQDDSDVAASVEHTIRLEKINNWLNSCGLRRFIDTSIKDNEIYITFKTPASGTMLMSIDTKQMKENLYPLNLKSVDFIRERPSNQAYFTIEDNYIQKMSDIFHKDFEVAGGGIYIQVSNCSNLKDFHGCPKEVNSFLNFNNPKITSLDGMPSVINNVLVFKIDSIDYHIYRYEGVTDVLNAQRNAMRLKGYGQKIVNKHIAILEDYYNHLDKKCEVAKSLKIIIDTIKTIKYLKIKK